MNLHRLDLVSLSLFTLIARTGSISAGAASARLAVGAASKRVSDLEAAVGTALFERHSRGVTLTPAGEALNLHAQRILGNVEQLAADLSDYARGVTGLVKVWANTSAVTQFMPTDLVQFMACHPGIRIDLQEENSAAIVMAVLDGRADLGVFAERTPTLGLQTFVYRSDTLILVVPRQHPLAGCDEIAFNEVAGYDFVSLSQGTSLAQRLADESQSLGSSLRVRIHVRSFDAMCQMVAAGLGIAVLPDGAAQPHLASMGLHRIVLSDAWSERQLLLGVRDVNALPRPARTLMDSMLVQ